MKPLDNEVTRRRVPASATMPEYWELGYMGEVIWKRLHEPTTEDIRDALNAHRNKPATEIPPLPKSDRYGRTPKDAA